MDLDLYYQDWQKRYLAAVDEETLLRDAAFISDFNYIGNIKVQSLTPRLFGLLCSIKHPFVSGGSIQPEHILTFLWLIKIKQDNETMESFYQSVIRENSLDNLYKETEDYFEISFNDSALGAGKEQASYYSSMAAIVDCIANEYGWNEKEILDTPYKRLFQYIKAIQKRHNPEKMMFNQSDRLKSELAKTLDDANKE